LLGLIIAAVIVAFILLLVFLPLVAYSIIAIVAVTVLVLLIIPIGVNLAYIDNKLVLNAKLWFYHYKLLPKTEKTADNKKASDNAKAEQKKKSPHGNNKAKKKLDLSFEEILEIIKKALKALSKFGKLVVHKFVLHYVAAGKDPYSTAMTYNYVNAALSSLAPCCSKAFKVKGEVDVWTDIDFTQDKMLLDAELTITLRLVQVLHTAFVAGCGILVVLLKNKYRHYKEKRVGDKLPATDINNKEINIQTEERMDSNG
jgi:hypothetical protein